MGLARIFGRPAADRRGGPGRAFHEPEIEWRRDRSAFRMNGFDFLTVQTPGENPELSPGRNCFLFHKTKQLVDDYLRFLRELPRREPFEGVLELGLYAGGSTPFWYELLRPRKLVGIDIQDRNDDEYLREYVAKRGLEAVVETHWRTSQSDRAALGAIVAKAFGGAGLDFVVDDASHLYDQTRASFEILFPKLRPGGLYLIEDWAWFHWRGLEEGWGEREPLTRLVRELVELVGSTRERLVDGLEVRGGFVCARRGPAPGAELEPFSLDDHVHRLRG